MTEQAKDVKLDDTTILAKAKSGETLTQQEEDHIAGAPNTGIAPEPDPEKGDVKDPEAEEQEADEEITEEDETVKPAATPEPTKDGEDEDAESDEEEAEKKPTEQGAAKKTPAEKPEERRTLINSELEKPDHLVDLSQFTPVEIGLYWDLKKQRRKNQKLTEENNVLKFKEIKTKIEKEEAEVKDDEADPLEGKEDDDLLTVGEIKKLLQPKKAKKEETKSAPIITTDAVRVQKIEAHERLKNKGITDLMEVVDFAESVLGDDPETKEILRETALAGGNVVEKTYWLIKGSTKWPDIEKVLKTEADKRNKKDATKKSTPSPENIDRAKRIEKNSQKVKTTGGTGGGTAPAGEYSVDEIRNMTVEDFKKLPKKVVDSILHKYGSEPNRNY